MLAVHKPAGLATQAVVGIDSMEARVRAMLMDRGDGDYLGVPHRLDRCVSGVMLFAWLKSIGQVDLVVQLCYVVFLGIIGGLMFIESLAALRRGGVTGTGCTPCP